MICPIILVSTWPVRNRGAFSHMPIFTQWFIAMLVLACAYLAWSHLSHPLHYHYFYIVKAWERYGPCWIFQMFLTYALTCFNGDSNRSKHTFIIRKQTKHLKLPVHKWCAQLICKYKLVMLLNIYLEDLSQNLRDSWKFFNLLCLNKRKT